MKIVVVDDDPLIRELIARCLALFGASVTLCENAFQGIIAVEEVRPDVALIDILMPGRNGLELMSQIRELEPEQGERCRSWLLPAYAIRTWRAKFNKRASPT